MPVTSICLHGILDSRIIPHLNSRIVPPVEAVANVAAIVECDLLFENSGVRPQHEFNRPLHSVYPVDVANLNGSAAVIFLAECKINR